MSASVCATLGVIGAAHGQGDVRRAGGRRLGAQALQQRQGLGRAVQLDQGVGATQQQLRIVGVHALQGLGVQALGLGVLAQARGGGGQAGAIGHGGGVIDGLGRGAIFALGIEDVARGLADLPGLGPAQELRRDDRQQIDQSAQGLDRSE